MKKLIATLVIAVCSLTTFMAQAQTSNASIEPKKWGVEFNVVWPFVPGVEIYTAKATRTIWAKDKAHGDLTFGVLWRPGTSDDENAEEFSEIGANIGYRHYFFKGFHAELALYPSFAKETKNKIDGKDYEGFALTTELYTGYKFNLGSGKNIAWYLMPQVGIGYNPISNLGPETEKNTPFPTLNLQVGFNF